MRSLIVTLAAVAVMAAIRLAAAQPAPPADSDDDLAHLPGNLDAPPPPPPSQPSALRGKLYADDVTTAAMRRSVDVAFPSPLPFDWQHRTSLDATGEWAASHRLRLVLSDRIDAVEQQAMPLWSRQTIRNELREAYATWQPVDGGYLEAGRINLREGTGLGFSPTDLFKPRTLVGQASLDPSVQSQNRLGTLMLRAQAIWTGGSASLAYAPRLFAPSAITSSALGLDPRFDATNASHRALATVATSLGDLTVQLIGYLEPRRSKLGLDLTQPVGDAIILYADATGGIDDDLVTRAADYGRATGTLPAAAPFPLTGSRGFRADLTAGGGYTLAALTLVVEYHFHQTGLSAADWDRWFDLGHSRPQLANLLWYIRGYASDQREPTTRQEIFARLAWPKATHALDLAAFSFVDLYDGSALSQATATYYLSDAWTAAASISAFLGRARSEQGSFPQLASAIVEITRYLR